jgi:tRNA-2-methylthio-N6-dimethylallyladenosine synthase
MNHAESERLVAFLVSKGYTGCDQPQDADLIIINGCVVRESAENRVVNSCTRSNASNKKILAKKIIVTGCYVSDDLEGLRRQYPFVDVFCPAGEMPALDDWVFPDTACLPLQASVIIYIPIIQGCYKF